MSFLSFPTIQESFYRRRPLTRILFLPLLLGSLIYLLPDAAAAQASTWLEQPRYWSEPPGRSLSEFPQNHCYVFALHGAVVDDAVLPQQRPKPSAKLGWLTSGIWEKGNLLLADTDNDGLFGFAPSVNSAGQSQYGKILFEDSAQKPYLESPFFITPRRDGGYLVASWKRSTAPGDNSSSAVVYFVGPDGTHEGSLQIREKRLFDQRLNEWMIGLGMSQMVEMNDGIFFVGDVTPDSSPEDYWTVFAFANRDPSHFKTFSADLSGETPSQDQASLKLLRHRFFKRDFHLLTSMRDETNGEDVAYILIMEEKPWIGKVRQTDDEISALPAFPIDIRIPEFDWKRPTSSAGDARQVRDMYRQVEENAMPVGLHSWDNRLFLITKSEARNGQSSWFLHEFSSNTGESVGQRVDLPIRSAHLALIPSREKEGFFAAIPKGPVDTFARLTFGNDGIPTENLALYRSTDSLVMFPASWLDQHKSISAKGPCLNIEAVSPTLYQID